MPDFGSFRGFGEKLTQGQTPTLLGLIGSVAYGFDVDAVAFFTRVINAGGVLSETEQNAVDVLVKQLKSNGIWSAMKAVYPMVGGSADSCRQNLKSSSFTGTFNGGWTFASTGATPNGTNAFMNTGLNPSTQLLQNSTHLSFYSRTNTTDSAVRVDIGLGSGTNTSLYLSCRINNTNGPLSNIHQTGIKLLNSLSNSLGYYLSSRVVSTERKLYANNSLIDTFVVTSQTPSNDTIIFGSNLTGEWSNRQCAFASIGDGLTDTQASNLYTAVQAFQTSLGRQV